MKKLRAIWRLLYFAVFTSWTIFTIILLSLLLGKDMRRSLQMRTRWARRLLPALGIRIEVQGAPPDFPCLFMGNHRSYLDPVLIIHDTPAYGVSKAEVASWPIIGFGAKVTGVIFLKRESAGSRKRTLAGIAEKLKEGFAVILFPEGTTHSEPKTIDFRLGGFRLAAEEGFPIVPVAIDYASSQDYWVGDDTFLPHFLRSFAQKTIKVKVRYGEAIRSEDPQELLEKAKAWIDSSLSSFRF